MNNRWGTAMQGLCQDPYCDEPNEPATLRLFRGLSRCDGCIEAIRDQDEFAAENAADLVGLPMGDSYR